MILINIIIEIILLQWNTRIIYNKLNKINNWNNNF